MTLSAPLNAFRERLPQATVRFAFIREETGPVFLGKRLDLLYTFPAEQHTGLLHWVDELSWYEGDLFITAMELSKFCRLQMKGHDAAKRLVRSRELVGEHPWPPPYEACGDVPRWLPTCNQWLHRLREAP